MKRSGFAPAALCLLALVLMAGFSGSVFAACPTGTTVSVSTNVPPPGVDLTGNPIKLTAAQAQTFLVPAGGASCLQLLGVTIALRKDAGTSGVFGDVKVAVWTTSLGMPSAEIATATAIIPEASISTTMADYDVTFSNPPSLIAGGLYAIVVTSSGTTGSKSYVVGGSTANPYADGQRWHTGDQVTWGGNSSHDIRLTLCFRPCPQGGCTLTQGYWKNHEENWPASATPMALGTVNYSKAQLLAILNEPVGGNGLISLAHQLIAAKLNIANGADGSAVASAIAAADAMIGSLVVPPVGGGWLDPAATSTLTDTLDMFNKGLIGPGHCAE
jgi:hypothetical protein